MGCPDEVGMLTREYQMLTFIGITKDENTTSVILAKARIQTCIHPRPLDSSLRWNDSIGISLLSLFERQKRLPSFALIY